MKRFLVIFLLFAFGIVYACSGDQPVMLPDAGMESGVKDAGPDCPPLPVMLFCRWGAPYKACGKDDQILE